MKYRVLTVSREYGSGGAEIARRVARELGWKLVDKELIDEISRRGNVSVDEAAEMDERADPWIHRLTRSMWGLGVDGISVVAPVDLFDAEKAFQLSRQIIEEAYKAGGCVIVGRGSQYILSDREDVFHAFIYARLEDKIRRIQNIVKPGTDVKALIQSMDAGRLEYIRLHFNQQWLDPHYYELMINSKAQPEQAAEIIIAAMKAA